MQLISFTSQKGGVGKSTFNWHLASALSVLLPHQTILYIDATYGQGGRSLRLAKDLDAQGHGFGRALHYLFSSLIPGLPLEAQDLSAGIAAAVAEANASIIDVETSATTTLKFLPAASTVLKSVIETRFQEPKPGAILSQFLADIKADITVVDMKPETSSPLLASYMAIADSTITIQDMRDVETVGGVTDMLKMLKQSELPLKGAVANFASNGECAKDAMDLFADICGKNGVELLQVFKDDQKSIVNGLKVYERNGRMASSLYVEMEERPAQKKNLQKIALQFERLAGILVN